jgi:O-antigen/teichoic acid export membrane protein
VNTLNKTQSTSFYKNILYAFSAQGVSLFLSVLMSLVVPKILGIEGFSYWQLFLFYIGYVGFSLFGLSDGFYLRLGGKNLNQIDVSLIGSQIKIAIVFQISIATIISLLSLFFITNDQRKFVLICTVIYMVLQNVFGCLGYIFQAINNTRIYSISVIIEKFIFIVAVIGLSIFKTDRFELFVVFYLISKAIATVYCIWAGSKIIFSSWCDLSTAFIEIWKNINVGIKLMIANIASMLILGSSRFFIDKAWGISSFGIFSLALSLTNFFLLFISQVSMVLFPTLKHSGKQQQYQVYTFTRNALGLFLPIIFLLYMPMKYLLEIWLPGYQESFKYLALLLPIATFDGKMNLLCNTYFKVLRKEKFLLGINILTMVLSLLLSLLSVFILRNIYAVIIFMVISIAFRSIISELYLAKIMNVNIVYNTIQEIIIVIIYMLSELHLSPTGSFIVFFPIYIVYLIINKKNLIEIVKYVKVKFVLIN